MLRGNVGTIYRAGAETQLGRGVAWTLRLLSDDRVVEVLLFSSTSV